MVTDDVYGIIEARRPWTDPVPEKPKSHKRRKEPIVPKVGGYAAIVRFDQEAKAVKLSYGKLEALRYERGRG